jgi:hypothetical protein
MPQRRSSTTKGSTFEKRVHNYLAAEIAANHFWAKKGNCRLYWKKGYHSRDRNSKITFDIAIELYLPQANEYSCVVLVECKDYSGSIPVDDIEEFFAKVQQVGAANAKAVFASTGAFQKGAREFARSKGIGLIRSFGPDNFKWELKRSPSASARSTSAGTLIWSRRVCRSRTLLAQSSICTFSRQFAIRTHFGILSMICTRLWSVTGRDSIDH